MGLIYTSDLVGVKQSVTDEFLLLNPYQIPMINMLGFGQAVTSTKHEWFEDEMFSQSTLVNGAVLVGGTSIVVDDIEPFRVNQIIKIADELLLVTAVTVGTLTLTVTRGYAGTTAAAIADNTVIEAMFTEGNEGSDARDARKKSRVAKYSYTQIFDDSIYVSGTAEAVAQHGINDLYETEKQKVQMGLALQLEKAIVNGVEYNSSNKRMMKGLRQYLVTNVTDAAAAALTLDHINNAAQAIYDRGGFATGGNYKLITGAKQRRAISKLNTAFQVVQRADNKTGNTVDVVVTDFGEFPIVLNSNLKSDELYIADANRMFIKPLQTREFGHTYLGKQGDYTKGTVVGEYTFQLEQEKAHARIKNLL